MKKKPATRQARSPAKRSRHSLVALVAEVRGLIESARCAAASTVNILQVLTNFEIGRRIVEHEQKGARRAGYGEEMLKELSSRLTNEFGRGFSVTSLQLMRRFFLEYRGRIQQTASVKLAATVTLPAVSAPIEIWQTSSAESARLFALNWSHYVELLSIQEPDERKFYELEAANGSWSVAELKRQKASCLYERLALSRDKEGVKKLAREGQLVVKPQDILKEPYVLEFLGLREESRYSESDLEQAIIDRLQEFLLELGKGFLFEARQKRFTFDGDHYFLDLVFYNRLLRSYVLIDLKLDKLTHQDLGQMQMYVNYYDREVKLPEENATIGLLLCKEKKDAIVKLTLPPNANIHAREYKLYLPSKELLQQKLIQWLEEERAPA